jgi:hypothetical protein
VDVYFLVDDDIEGKNHKEKIKNINPNKYNDSNVLTIRDIE